MPKMQTYVIFLKQGWVGCLVWSRSFCLLSRAECCGPMRLSVLCLAGRLLTVSAVSPYTDEWEVSRPFPKLSFPRSNASSRGMAEKTWAPSPARQLPSRAAPTLTLGMAGLNLKMLPLKGEEEGVEWGSGIMWTSCRQNAEEENRNVGCSWRDRN